MNKNYTRHSCRNLLSPSLSDGIVPLLRDCTKTKKKKWTVMQCYLRDGRSSKKKIVRRRISIRDVLKSVITIRKV